MLCVSQEPTSDMMALRRFLGFLLPAAALALFWYAGTLFLTGRFSSHSSSTLRTPGDPATDPVAAQSAHQGYLTFLNSGHLR